MTPELLRECGRALYGRVYKRQLAEALCINERTLNRWLAGTYNIPDDITGEVILLLRKNGDDIDEMIELLECVR